MRHERMPTLNVSALVVSFFGFTGNLKATARVRQRGDGPKFQKAHWQIDICEITYLQI